MSDVLVWGSIMTICMYPFVLIMYAMLKSEATPKKGMYYGVTLTKEQAKAPEIIEISKRYNKQMNRTLLWLLVLPIPALIIPWFSIWFVLWDLWFLYTMVGFFLPFFTANKSMKALKAEKGWQTESEIPVYVELKEAGTLRTVKSSQFLPQCLISLVIFVVTILIGSPKNRVGMGVVQGSLAGVTFLFWVAAIWLDKVRTQVISTNSDVNVNYNRAKKRFWKKLWIACAWLNVGYMAVVLVLIMWDVFPKYFLISSLVYALITTFLALWMLKKQADLEKKYRDKMDIMVADDDEHWLGGMFYYNPKDKHLSVEKRHGMGSGTTINLAKPAAKVLVGLLILVMLPLPLSGVWMVMLEFTPIELRVEENMVIGDHIGEDISIPLHSIKNVELLPERPKMSKHSGVGMETVCKGSFRLKEDKSYCQIFLDPRNDLCLRVETSMEVYYLGGFNDEQTRQVYEMIQGK